MELIKEKKNRRQRLVDATRNTDLFTFTSKKSQTIWNSVKVQMKAISPMPEFWHLRSTKSSEGTRSQAELEQDEEEGLFCNSLLDLMQTFDRYDFLKPKSSRKQTEDSNGEEGMEDGLRCLN